jgi:hypothetical protein
MYHPKMEIQISNEHNARMPMPIELLDGNKNLLQLPRLQVNTKTTPDKATTTSGEKCPQLQQTTSTKKVV